MNIKYTIGKLYKHRNSKISFKLLEVKGWWFVFDKDYSCTDNVFVDMIDTVTGIQVSQDLQLQLF